MWYSEQVKKQVDKHLHESEQIKSAWGESCRHGRVSLAPTAVSAVSCRGHRRIVERFWDLWGPGRENPIMCLSWIERAFEAFVWTKWKWFVSVDYHSSLFTVILLAQRFVCSRNLCALLYCMYNETQQQTNTRHPLLSSANKTSNANIIAFPPHCSVQQTTATSTH